MNRHEILTNEEFIELRSIFVGLYNSERVIKRVAKDSGLNTDNMEWGGSVTDMWDMVLTDSMPNRQVAIEELVLIAKRENPKNKQLEKFFKKIYEAMKEL